MAKKQIKSWDELSDYEKFTGVLDGFRDIPNERLIDKFVMLTNRYVESEQIKAKAIVISPELQEIEKILLDYRERCKHPHCGPNPDWMLEVTLLKKAKELYGKV
jgi:hypothetical protein